MLVLGLGTSTSAMIAAWTTFGLAAVGLLYARTQVSEARILREQQTRPYVVVDFAFRSFLVDIVIENIGATFASDVRIEFDPPVESAIGDVDLVQQPAIASGIPMLAPRRRVVFFFDSYITRSEKKLPMTYSVVVRYAGPTGTAYSDPFTLDLAHMEGTLMQPSPIRDVVEEGFKKLNETLGKWTSGFTPLKIIDRTEQEREERRERAERYEQMRSEEERRATEEGAAYPEAVRYSTEFAGWADITGDSSEGAIVRLLDGDKHVLTAVVRVSRTALRTANVDDVHEWLPVRACAFVGARADRDPEWVKEHRGETEVLLIVTDARELDE